MEGDDEKPQVRWEAYLRNMALHDRTWGDELTLRALAAFFCVRVQVISSTSEEPVDIEPVEGAERLAERAVLYLGHFHEFHYVSLVRLT